MRKLLPIALGLQLLAACAASHGVVQCSNDSNNATPPPPDSGFGPPERLEGSYRRMDVPAYPQAALDDKIAGTVYVHVWVRTDGRVSDAAVEQVHPRSAAVLAEGLAGRIRAWLFNPIETRGRAVASEFIVPVKFSIGDLATPTIEPAPSSTADVFVLETVIVQGNQRR
jgi:TonB family protein